MVDDPQNWAAAQRAARKAFTLAKKRYSRPYPRWVRALGSTLAQLDKPSSSDLVLERKFLDLARAGHSAPYQPQFPALQQALNDIHDELGTSAAPDSRLDDAFWDIANQKKVAHYNPRKKTKTYKEPTAAAIKKYGYVRAKIRANKR
jgi:hypothetical protein